MVVQVGEVFKVNELKERPGVYTRYSNDGESPRAGSSAGVAAALIQADWGPMEEVITLHPRDVEQLKHILGEGDGVNVVKSLFSGGASMVQVVRVGNSGEPATAKIGDESGVIHVTTKYPTNRDISVMIRESVMGDEKDIIIQENERRLESYRISAGEGEAEEVVEALKSSAYLDVVKVTDGELPANASVPLEGGSSPKITAEDYTDAMSVIESANWQVIVSDTDNIAVLNAIKAFCGRLFNDGARVYTVLPTGDDVPFDKRLEMTKMFNSFYTFLVGHRFNDLTSVESAAFVAGESIRGDYRRNLSKKPVAGGYTIPDKLTKDQYTQAAKAGLITFDYDHRGRVVIDYAVNTLQQEDETFDLGWRSLRRLRTRYELVDRITYEIADTLSRGAGTSGIDLHQVITLGNRVIKDMMAEGGLKSGEMILDPTKEPEGDSAWFTFEGLHDLDGLNKVYVHFPLRY